MDTLLVGAQLSDVFFILQGREAYHHRVATVYLVSISVQVLIRCIDCTILIYRQLVVVNLQKYSCTCRNTYVHTSSVCWLDTVDAEL